MDINQALAVLNLKPDACMDEAKISFRILAKKYHPDKLQFNSIPVSENGKMKEINAAFHYLKQHLKPRKIYKTQKREFKHKRYKDHEKNPSGESFSSLFKKVYKSFFRSPTTKSRRQYKKTTPKFQSRTDSRDSLHKRNNFESVLNNTITGSPDTVYNDSLNRKPEQKINRQNTYASYMRLKQKMRPKRRLYKTEGFTPIEKIRPVSSINKT